MHLGYVYDAGRLWECARSASGSVCQRLESAASRIDSDWFWRISVSQATAVSLNSHHESDMAIWQ